MAAVFLVTARSRGPELTQERVMRALRVAD